MPTWITDNYLWFLIGAIVIVMALVGYYADKTDFGRNKPEKKPREKKIKEKKVKEKQPKEELAQEPVEEVAEEQVKLKEEKKKKRRKKEKKEKKQEEVQAEPKEENMLDSFTLPEEVPEEVAIEPIAPIEDSAVVDPLLTPPTMELEESQLTPVSKEEDLLVGPDGSKETDSSVFELNEKLAPLEEVTEANDTDDVWKF